MTHRAEAALLCTLDPRLLATVRDWDWLIATARVHGVLPRLERMVRNANGATPDPLRVELRARARESADRTLRLTGELFRILDAFTANGVRALAYKGPTLAVLAYGDLALRPFRDLDIVVDPTDVATGRALLERLGYHPDPLDPSCKHQSAFLAHGSECAYLREPDDIVELHWRMLPPYFAMQIPFATLWERRAAVSVGGRAVPTLAREDLVLALCAHGTHHRWDRLEWIADIGRLLRPETGVNWRIVVERARRLGGTRMVGLATRLAADLLVTELPPACATLARERAVAPLAAAVRAALFARNPGPEGGLRVRLFQLRAHTRLRDRVRFLLQVVARPNQADWAVVQLPNALAPLYYLIRPLRLAAKYSARLLQALVR